MRGRVKIECCRELRFEDFRCEDFRCDDFMSFSAKQTVELKFITSIPSGGKAGEGSSASSDIFNKRTSERKV